MKPFVILTVSVLSLCGCGTGGDDYPNLMPTAAMLAEPALPDHVPASTAPKKVRTESMSRAESLRGRADALRAPVIEPDIRSRMNRRN